MSKGKFKKRFIVIPLLVLLVGGGAFGAVKLLQRKDTVNVAPVSDAVAETKMYTLDEMGDTYYGKLVKGSVASIKTNPELKIESVKVKKGDESVNYVRMSYREAKKFIKELEEEAEEEAEEAGGDAEADDTEADDAETESDGE